MIAGADILLQGRAKRTEQTDGMLKITDFKVPVIGTADLLVPLAIVQGAIYSQYLTAAAPSRGKFAPPITRPDGESFLIRRM